jgi:hypothetical protein
MTGPAERAVLAWGFRTLGLTAKASRGASRRRRRSHHLRSTTTQRKGPRYRGKGELTGSAIGGPIFDARQPLLKYLRPGAPETSNGLAAAAGVKGGKARPIAKVKSAPPLTTTARPTWSRGST